MAPDNMKEGFTKHQRGESWLNKGYGDLVDHYYDVAIPTRLRFPKDNSSVEESVGFISRQIIAALLDSNAFESKMETSFAK